MYHLATLSANMFVPNPQARPAPQRAMRLGYVLPRAAIPEDPIRIAVLISGGGSGLEALLNYQHDQPRCHRTILVLADSPHAGGLEHGSRHGVKSVSVPLPMEINKPNINIWACFDAPKTKVLYTKEYMLPILY